MSTEAVFTFNLGDKVRDRITGQVGIISSRTEHLFSCARYWIDPQELKDGKPVEGRWIDEDAMELVHAGAIVRKRYRVYEEDTSVQPLRKAGGPSDQPSSSNRQSGR